MKRALISVYKKEGIVEFARKLEDLGWEIISTGGSAKLLKEENIKVRQVEDISDFPEILDGRVKTLHPSIHGGILYKRGDRSHEKTIEDMEIGSIDMIVNNLYPFQEMLRKKASQEEIIENIDIGGPAMIRAGGKNYKDVIVVTDPQDYKSIIARLREDRLDLAYRLKLAKKAFNYTAAYDSTIAGYFNRLDGDLFPNQLSLTYEKVEKLRYGENPHQKAAFYKEVEEGEGSLAQAKQIHGRELSFNNINDSNGAIKILKEFSQPTVVGVKHANPSGIGSGDTIDLAYEKMFNCDQESIFGGVVAANRKVNKKTAEYMSQIFLEVIIAPAYSEEALKILKRRKNIRLLQIDRLDRKDYKEFDLKKTIGGLLVQERDEILLEDYQVVTKRQPSKEELEDLLFAFKASKHINSNGVVIAKNQGTLGLGLGEVNRYWASKKAIERSGKKVKGAVLASDGFFPFKDSIEILGQAGIKAIIQPGGSIKDQEVIEEADRHGIAMIFTGIRHFKH